MPIELISPVDKFMLKRTVDARPIIIDHLRSVLKSFAAKPGYTKFYIGITRDLPQRFAAHHREKPDFKLMVPIYEEQAIVVDTAFDILEHEAIQALRSGIVHPETKKTLLACANGPDGARPKTLLYVLIG